MDTYAVNDIIYIKDNCNGSERTFKFRVIRSVKSGDHIIIKAAEVYDGPSSVPVCHYIIIDNKIAECFIGVEKADIYFKHYVQKFKPKEVPKIESKNKKGRRY